MSSDPATGLHDVLARIAAARKAAIAPASHTTLIAVTKTHGVERIAPVIAAGHRDFGENRVQEARGKWPALKAQYSDIVLHLIGPLQTNKVRDALELFDAIHSLDRPKLAETIAREAERTGRMPKLLVQVNTGEEPQKAGIDPRDTEAFIDFCRETQKLPIAGLMCVPPVSEPPAPHFALLQKLARETGLSLLSMGMSGDFETAIKFGATHVRVGTAIFGER
ncbi:MAG TPA: YggS family pyridoxal phosphate-dependent enzyme [Rhizomicrobium sp.]|jgi:pyridoxal phosphate enzyme (YggS family)|nr:YggS family pyridoxal phosphate-dependent enzyme [Rhizomicrobium sp.]